MTGCVLGPAVIVDSALLDTVGVAALVDVMGGAATAAEEVAVEAGVGTVAVSAELDRAGVEEPVLPAVFVDAAFDGASAAGVAVEDAIGGAAVLVVVAVVGFAGACDDALSVCAYAPPLTISRAATANDPPAKCLCKFFRDM